MENDVHINEKLAKQKLNELFAEYKTIDPNDEKTRAEHFNDLIDELVMRARYLSPVEIKDSEDGGQELTFRLIKSPKGESYFPVFTSSEDLALWKELKGAQTVQIAFDQYAQMLSGNNGCYGFVVNPFSDNFRVDKQVALQWYQQKQIKQNGFAQNTITNNSDIKLFDLEPYPEELSEKLRGAAAADPAINRVWLQGITLEGADGYLVVVELNGDAKEHFTKLGNETRPFLNGFPIHFVPYSNGFGEQAVKDKEPIFTKS